MYIMLHTAYLTHASQEALQDVKTSELTRFNAVQAVQNAHYSSLAKFVHKAARASFGLVKPGMC